MKGDLILLNLIMKPLKIIPRRRYIHSNQIEQLKLQGNNPAFLTELNLRQILHDPDRRVFGKHCNPTVTCTALAEAPIIVVAGEMDWVFLVGFVVYLCLNYADYVGFAGLGVQF